MEIDQVDLDIVDVINKTFPFEKHLPGMKYCGPGTNLKKKLLEDGVTPRKEYQPSDRVDEIALQHDIAYSRYENLVHRVEADKTMLKELRHIKNPTCTERMERCVVYPIMAIKHFFDIVYLRIFG